MLFPNDHFHSKKSSHHTHNIALSGEGAENRCSLGIFVKDCRCLFRIVLFSSLGVLSAWYVKSIIDSKTFLVNLTDAVKSKWAKDKGKTVNETIREGVVLYIGTPIHKLLQ